MSEYIEISAEEFNEYVDSLEKEIEALKAQVGQLNALIIKMQERATLFLQPDSESESEFVNFIIGILDGPEQRLAQSTSAQCLAEIKAQAVDDIVNWDHSYVQDGDGEFYFSSSAIEQYANQLRQQAEATNQTPEQSGVSVSDARQFDVRGYSWAIASNDGGVIASGSQPALAAKSETNTLGYLMDYSDRVGGDLYLAPTDLKNFDPIDTSNLIMGMTWDQLNAKQQGKALPSAIKSKMPSGVVKVYANGKLIGDSLSRQGASAESRKQKAKLSLQKGNQLRQQAAKE